ncbi:multiple sugar transport system substrate-binding protein [Rhodospirillales bacterium URHD0017]|nr:multiple sugar transport system substrate-binding protein [Rhodospirillales bacterium URHD0017]
MIDDPWFPQLAPDLAPLRGVSQSLLEDIVPASLALGKDPYKTGVLKALPFVGNTQLLFIRTDLMKGNAPKTWDELIDMARQERAPQLNRYGYAIRGRAGAPVVSDFLPIYWSSGGRITDRSPSGRLTSVFDERLFQGALRTYGELRDLSPPGAINFDWPEMTSALVGGRALMQLNWPIAIPELIRPRPGSAPPKWTIALPPEVKGSATPATSMIGNWLLGIPRASTQSEAAQGFLVWLLDQQERVADEGRSPTRQSVFDVLARKKPYFAEIRTALERSTPRDRTERWSQIEEAISRAVTGYLAQPSSDEVYSRRLTTELNRILQRQ